MVIYLVLTYLLFPLYFWWTTSGAQKVFQIDHTAINVQCISLITINWRQKYYCSWIWCSYWPQIIVFWDVMPCSIWYVGSSFLKTLTLYTRLHCVISEALGDWEARIWDNYRVSQHTWKPLIYNYYDMQYMWTKNFACQEPQYFCLEAWPCHISKHSNIYYVCSLLVLISTVPYSILFQTLPLPAKV